MNQFYETNHQQYFAATVAIDPSTFLAPLADFLRPGATVLDVGCGSGRDLLWLRQRGFSATGLELSPSLARLASDHASCPVWQGDFCHYNFSDLSFAALVFVGSLVHQAKDAVPALLRSACGALVAGGHILLTMKEGQGRLLAPDGREFTLWSEDELAEVFRASSLQIVSFSRQRSQLQPDDIWLGYLLRMAKGG
ncbi:MAG: class I SAM-dependent methyltransferase [Thermodesulfobacteriota bacterium]